MKNKISNLVKENRVIDSKSFNNLTPRMKEVVKKVYDLIESEQKDIITRFDEAVEKVVASHNVNKKDLYDYFDNETKEQLGIK